MALNARKYGSNYAGDEIAGCLVAIEMVAVYSFWIAGGGKTSKLDEHLVTI